MIIFPLAPDQTIAQMWSDIEPSDREPSDTELSDYDWRRH